MRDHRHGLRVAFVEHCAGPQLVGVVPSVRVQGGSTSVTSFHSTSTSTRPRRRDGIAWNGLRHAVGDDARDAGQDAALVHRLATAVGERVD